MRTSLIAIARIAMEPIENKGLRVYDCPVCHLNFTTTYEEAKKHVNTPLSRGLLLPRGFTFGTAPWPQLKNEKGYEIKVVKRGSIIGPWNYQRDAQITNDDFKYHTAHEFLYVLEDWNYNFWKKREHPEINSWDCVGTTEAFSNHIAASVSGRGAFILSIDQFEEFKNTKRERDPALAKEQGRVPDSELFYLLSGIEQWLGK